MNLSFALRHHPSWSRAIWLLLLSSVAGCAVADTPACKKCYRDCGFPPADGCRNACEDLDECQPDAGDMAGGIS